MKTSNNGINLIKRFEGCRLKAYQDSVGVWTIGYGHTSGVKKGQVIIQAKAEEFLKSDLTRFEKNVAAYDGRYHWNQNEFDALVSFAFNIGSINQLVANGTRTRSEISNKFSAYSTAKKGGVRVVLPGLAKRRQAEKELFDRATSKKTTTAEDVKMTTLKNGSKGKAVCVWQAVIGLTGKSVDGIMGANTVAATKKFQKNHGLDADGVVGEKTWKTGLKSV